MSHSDITCKNVGRVKSSPNAFSLGKLSCWQGLRPETLVLHVRDSGTGQAAREVLAMLQDMGMTDLPIHRHCFTGDAGEYFSWCTALPNCYFGIARASLDNQDTTDTLLLMEQPTRLLLETDAPYLPMGRTDCPHLGILSW